MHETGSRAGAGLSNRQAQIRMDSRFVAYLIDSFGGRKCIKSFIGKGVFQEASAMRAGWGAVVGDGGGEEQASSQGIAMRVTSPSPSFRSCDAFACFARILSST
jgi:hypothetical protein